MKINLKLIFSLDKKKFYTINENILYGIILFFLFKYWKKNTYSNSIIILKNSSVKLKDIAGLEYAKQEIFEFIDFLKNKEKYIKAGAKNA